MEVPKQFKAYSCEGYFHSEQFVNGVWDAKSQLWLLVSASEIVEKPELSFLVIGRPGTDGIEFGFRKGLAGIWACYPIEQKFVLIATDVSALVERWFSGGIEV